MITSISPYVFLWINGTCVEGPSALIERMDIHREIYVGPSGLGWVFSGSLQTHGRARNCVRVDGHVFVGGCGTVFMCIKENPRNKVLSQDLRLIPAEESEHFRAIVHQVVVAPRFDGPRRTNRTLAARTEVANAK